MGDVLFLVAFIIGFLTLYFIAPLMALFYFIVNLVYYIKTPAKDEPLKKRRKIILIINTIIMIWIFITGVLLANSFGWGIGRM